MMNKPLLLLAGFSTAFFCLNSHAATVYNPTRAGVDMIVGNVRETNAPAEGYYADTAIQPELVGGTGSSATSDRYAQNLVYRYTLPTLAVGESIQSFTFNYQIYAVRDYSNKDFELDVYLLNTPDATATGSDFFYMGTDDDPDTDVAFIGNHYEAVGVSQVTLDPPVDVSFTVSTGAALTLLQSFYGGDHIPDQSEIAIRFNLDDAFNTGNIYNRYYVEDDVTTSDFSISVVPEPSTMTLLLGSLGLLALRRRRA